MKKLLALLLSIVTLFACVSCLGTDAGKKDLSYTIGVVDGAPALSVVNIADGFDYSDEFGKASAKIKIAANAQAITAGLTNGTFDMAIVPLNLASTLYNKSQNLGIKLASVNIFGVLYMVGKEDLADLSSLKGKVVYSVGAGGTPEMVFKHILSENNIEYADGNEVLDQNVVYFNAVAEAKAIIAGFKQGSVEYAILGEPAVTQVNANTGSKVVLDLQAEWKKIHGGNFVQAGLAVKAEVAKNSAFVNALVQKLAQNKDYLYQNVDTIGSILTAHESSLKVNFTTALLDRCYVGSVKSSECRADVENFLSALHAFKPASIGGALPKDDFYM